MTWMAAKSLGGRGDNTPVMVAPPWARIGARWVATTDPAPTEEKDRVSEGVVVGMANDMEAVRRSVPPPPPAVVAFLPIVVASPLDDPNNAFSTAFVTTVDPEHIPAAIPVAPVTVIPWWTACPPLPPIPIPPSPKFFMKALFSNEEVEVAEEGMITTPNSCSNFSKSLFNRPNAISTMDRICFAVLTFSAEYCRSWW